MATPLHVIATAGHVDHGKSSLIVRLTGIDPDRWEEEKRRGLTIDLGFAWTALPSGREVGFVDVPGHERFIRNMLAGVGSVRLVLFVVAADEGWKPQSEEHLEIVDVLGADGGLVALTKRDLVDDATLERRRGEVRERLADTVLAEAPLVACSSATGAGIDDLRAALDDLLERAAEPDEDGRARLALDRSFTVHGAGTVVTGTLTGGRLAVGDEVEVHPTGVRARIRSLQTHRRPVEVARPVSRVAANLVGVPRGEVERGDVLTGPGQWRATDTIEVWLRPVRSVDRPLSPRGAYKLYLGSAERDVALRLYDARELPPGGEAYGRLRLSRAVVAEVGDRFVLREAGRRRTVAGGIVLDADPPRRAGEGAAARLARRRTAGRLDLPELIVDERLAVPAADLRLLVGADPPEGGRAVRLEGWWVARTALEAMTSAVRDELARYHAAYPLRPGREWADVRTALAARVPAAAAPLERGLAAPLLAHLASARVLERDGTIVRLAGHRVSLGAREDDAQRLLERVRGAEPRPPDRRELAAEGFDRELVDAAVSAGRLVAVGDDLVVTPGFAERAESVARAEASRPEGLTVSRYRELLGTSRKYALPLLERLDRLGITRREDDVRRTTT